MRKFLFLSCFLILAGCAQKNQNSVTIRTENGEKTVYVEIADEPLEQYQGLRNRAELGEDGGMWFIFPDFRKRVFTMQDVLIPLDMIFVDENLTIIEIFADREPISVYDGRELTYSKNSAKYVLEVNGGYAEKNNIKIGDKIYAKSL